MKKTTSCFITSYGFACENRVKSRFIRVNVNIVRIEQILTRLIKQTIVLNHRVVHRKDFVCTSII